MAFYGVTLSDLNGFMKNYATGTIVPQEYFWKSLYDALKGSVTKSGFVGDQAELLIQTGFPFTGTAFGEDVDIPYPDDLGFTRQYIPLKEVIVNAGLTRQALNRAVGGNSSWGRIVDLVLRAQRQEFEWLMELCSIGDGTGRLARVSTSSHSGGVLTVTCDNTYSDFGWENVALLKPGMLVEFIHTDGDRVTDATNGVYDATGTNSYRVVAVTFGSRNNGAATTGTFTVAATNDIDAGTASHGVVDGTLVCMAGTWSSGITDSTVAFGSTAASGNPGTVYEVTNFSSTYDAHVSLPMGLVGLVQTSDAAKDYSDGSINLTLDTFQGLARASHANLRSTVYWGTDFGGTDGTPSDWDLSTISDAISQVDTSTGGKVDMLMCSSELAMAIHRRNRTESNITVNVSSTGSQNQNAVGAQFASKFLCPDGRVIPIKVSKTIPRNVLYGLTTEDLRWFTKGDFDFLRLNGDVWDKSYADRKANFEAPYGGMMNIGAERCDRCFVIQDMADNI